MKRFHQALGHTVDLAMLIPVPQIESSHAMERLHQERRENSDEVQ